MNTVGGWRGLVLAAPAFRIRLYVPLAIPLLRLLVRVKNNASVKSYVRARMLTHDAAEAAAYDADPEITRIISAKVLLGMHDTAKRILTDGGAIETPTLLFSAGTDYVVDNRVQRSFFAALSAVRKEQCIFPDMYHGIFYETGRHEAIAQTRTFIQSCFAQEPHPSTAPSAYTSQEHAQLQAPATWVKKLFFGAQILALKTVGRLSHGIRVGLETGFNSGASLDHVYRNQARGTTWLGQLIDRGYLNAIGWRGIRLRKESLKRWIRQAVAQLQAQGREIRILDVAAGPGRYLLEAKRELDPSVEILLRDLDPANVAAARQQAAEWHLQNITCAEADAFDPQSYATFAAPPTIAVVSGLYELFSDNEQVLRSLNAISGALASGGYLIVTGQPWHPQMELIARTLTNRDGTPWVMRRRPQRELNDLLAAAGFKRVDSSIDAFGIFTVTLAQKEM